MLSAAVCNLRAGIAAELWPRLCSGSGEIRFLKLRLESLGVREGEAGLAGGARGAGAAAVPEESICWAGRLGLIWLGFFLAL